MREVLEDHTPGRQRQGIPRHHAARCRCSARMAEASQEKALRVRLWGALSVLGLVFAALSFGVDQTFKWWMLYVIDIEMRQPIAILPVFDIILAWNHGVSSG